MHTDQSLHLDIYINYPGHCEEAFTFYEQHPGSKITFFLPVSIPHRSKHEGTTYKMY